MKFNLSTLVKSLILSSISLLLAISVAVDANAAGTGSFEVGAYWQPPIFSDYGGDYNTNANWANIAAAHIDSIEAVRVPANSTLDKTLNESGIATVTPTV